MARKEQRKQANNGLHMDCAAALRLHADSHWRAASEAGRWARALSCPVVCSVLLGLSGCDAGPHASPELEPKISELAGMWKQDTTATNPSHACLSLNADHTCVATNFFVVAGMDGLENISGGGKWKLENSDLFGWTVVVTLRELGTRGVPVQNRRAPFLLGRPGATPVAHRFEEMFK
jgi:hypothetical protein